MIPLLTLAVSLAAAVVLAAAIGCLALAVVAARRLVQPRPRPTLRVIACDQETVTLPATIQTLYPGIFGIWAARDNTHTAIGRILDHDRYAHTVRRRITHPGTRLLQAGEKITWTSHVFPDPAALAPDYQDLTLHADGHSLPTWLIPGSAGSTRWAIHIHGVRTTRVTTLRGIPATQQAGMTSLVISYRGDGEADYGVPATPSMLGTTEWNDLEPALRYAADHGATHITLIAWSMGAQIAFHYLQQGTLRDRITGLVLVAPVINWHTVLVYGLHHAHLPAALLTRIAAGILARPGLHALAGTPEPLHLDRLDWAHTSLAVPTLIIHSHNGTETPIASSRVLAHTNPDVVRLIEPDSPGHALEYNTNPRQFTNSLVAWLGSAAE